MGTATFFLLQISIRLVYIFPDYHLSLKLKYMPYQLQNLNTKMLHLKVLLNLFFQITLLI